MATSNFTRPKIWQLAAAGLLVTLAVMAQEQPPASVYFEQVEVNVVNLEVFVTDSDGRRVVGLTKDDFDIYEDGERVEITNFFAVDREDRILRSAEAEELPDATAAPTTEPRLLPAEQRLNLLVYFDNFNMTPGNRTRLVDQVGGFIEDRIALGDNVMLVGSFRTPQVVVPLTRDPQAIGEGIEKLKKSSTYRQVDEAQLRQTMRAIEEAFAAGKPREAHGWVRTYVQSATADLRVSAHAITDMVRSLSGLPGRKAIIYVGEGLPQRPGEELYQFLLDLFGQQSLDEVRTGGFFVDPSLEAIAEDQTELFNVISREANANQVTFYTFDATGGRVSSGISSEVRKDTTLAGGQTTLAAMRVMNLQQPLIDMAEGTGGASVLNTFNFDEALERVAADFDSFYSLGYMPSSGGDGKFHKIEVRVKHPELKVRHRSGYMDKPLEERVGDRTIASAVFGLEKNPLEISVDFGDASRIKKGRYHLPVMVRIPIRVVTLVPGDDQEVGRLEIFLTVKDDEGISDLHRQTYPVEIPQELMEEAMDKDIGYSVTLEVRPGQPTVAVGVWDAISGLESFVHKPVRVAQTN